jgi:hypothetical protein
MTTEPARPPSSSSPLILILAWLAVGLPLLWGVALTISKALVLFR